MDNLLKEAGFYGAEVCWKSQANGYNFQSCQILSKTFDSAWNLCLNSPGLFLVRVKNG